ncbi:hypothetical protein ERJ75_000873300 [Trypanosoma vivax]|nr:hypothetical protein ERJ75_000873300 [Trypanosoma vivax]
MFKTFLLCAAALCALRFATAHGQAIGQAETKDIHEQITVECDKLKEYKFNASLAKSVGKYTFMCFEHGQRAVIGLSVEGDEATKKLSGLGGSRAWCTYDGVVDNFIYACADQREPRSMPNVPKESCTVWEQDDNVSWFDTLVLDEKNVTCSVSGMYGDLMYSFKAEKPSNKPEEPKSVTLHVTVFAAKGFLPPDPKPLSPPASPTSNKELAPATKNEKQGDASRHTAQPGEGDKASHNTASEPAGKSTSDTTSLAEDGSREQAEVEASRGHASAAAALSLVLLVCPFAA